MLKKPKSKIVKEIRRILVYLLLVLVVVGSLSFSREYAWNIWTIILFNMPAHFVIMWGVDNYYENKETKEN